MPLNFQQPKFWAQINLISCLLLPFSAIFLLLITIRRFYYLKIKKPSRFKVPVIVVGNISVGGSGKTPVVIWLAEFLKQHGFKPGIVSRGYGGDNQKPCEVTANSDPEKVGDEALVIVRRTSCPMVICKNRVAAVQQILATYFCDIIISDDGLQHYALARDIEIAVIDEERGFGNGFCLPAGPLREPLSRLQKVDFIVGETKILSPKKCYTKRLLPGKIINLKQPALNKEISDFFKQEIHAFTGIGNPDKFFNLLEDLGLQIMKYPFPDHHKFKIEDFSYADKTIMMTEKDAVKCEKFATENFWYLPVILDIESDFGKNILAKLKSGFS